MTMNVNNSILVTKALSKEAIGRLISEDISVLVVTSYYREDICDYLANRLLNSGEVQPYTHEMVENGEVVQKYYGVDRVGFPFNLTYEKPSTSSERTRYYQQAKNNSLRHFSSPYISPIDKLRVELDELYELGTTVASFEGLKMVSGIGRISGHPLSHLSAVQPHFDALPPTYAALDRQFAANIYLKLPPSGGALEVWDVASLNPLTKVPENWRAVLPKPLIIEPQKGDLILFNCRKPHAIGEFSSGVRVTAQTFIGFKENQPLVVWT